MADQRSYSLPEDVDGIPFGGADDGTGFFPARVFNKTSLGSVNVGPGLAYAADWGVKDSDLYNVEALANWYIANLTGASDNADNTLTFSGTVHQVILDNSRASTPLYVELAATAASTSSVAIIAGAVVGIPCNTATMHFWTADHTKIQIRGQ